MNKFGNYASILGLILAIIQILQGTFQLMITGAFLTIFFVLLIISKIEKNSSKHYLIAQKKSQDIHYEIATSYEKYKSFTLDKSVHELSNICFQIAKMLTELRHCEVSVCVKYTNTKDDIYYDPISNRHYILLNNFIDEYYDSLFPNSHTAYIRLYKLFRRDIINEKNK